MINLELASILTSIAEIYKFESKRQDKILNLSRAARTIRDLELDAEDSFKRGELAVLPGMNDFSYSLVSQYFEEGKINLFEEIKKLYDEELIKIVRLSGLGPKIVFSIYEKLHVSRKNDLRTYFMEKSVGLKKFALENDIDPLFIDRIKYSFEYMESLNSRTPRWQAINSANKIVNALMQIKEIFHIKTSGSLRRRKSEIGDIDLILIPQCNLSEFNISGSKSLIDKINRLKFIKSLIRIDKRENNISAKFATIFGIDLEVLITSKKMWATDLIISTGSKKHIEELEQRANSFGFLKEGQLDFSEVNLKNFKFDNSVFEDDEYICTEEKNIYSNMKMAYIHPELREGFGEIKLASEGFLPNLIKLSDIKGDLHVHSQFSDGIIDIKDVMKNIKNKNYEYLSFSDHSAGNVWGNGLDKNRIKEKFEYIEKLNAKQKKALFIAGSEIEINEDGSLDYEDEIIEKFDIAIASIHRGFKFSAKTNNLRFKKAIENKRIDIIAHPTGVVFKSRAPFYMDIDELIFDANKYGKALEINSYYLRLDLNETNARKAKKAGSIFSINTDSHRANNLEMIRLGVDNARKAGIEKEDVINCFSLNELKKWKKNR